jgi:ethylmalonyl-CoA/methylmalonyl-CoA decarboxylase
MNKARTFLSGIVAAAGKSMAKVEFEQIQNTGIITLFNPDRHNAMSPSMMLQLDEIVQYLESPATNLNFVLLRGSAGKSFCAGMDLSMPQMHTPEAGRHMSVFMTNTLDRLCKLPAISVACLDGAAIGGGAELAISCDLRMMSPNAYLWFVQFQMGVIPGWGACSRLVEILGRHEALKVLLSMRKIKADEALSSHLCNGMLADKATSETSLLIEQVQDQILPKFMDDIDRSETVRALKRAIARPNEEHEIFSSLWGRGANLQMLSKRKS